MRSPFVIAGAFTLFACVPASEKLPAAGALGFVTEPTPVTQGEPFVTSDGWTIRIHELTLRTSFDVYSTSDEDGGGLAIMASDRFRFDARRKAEFFTPGIKTGPGYATLSLEGSYIRGRDFRPNESSDPMRARFRTAADIYSNCILDPSTGPSVQVAVGAWKDGRTITFDLTLSTIRPMSFPSGAGVGGGSGVAGVPLLEGGVDGGTLDWGTLEDAGFADAGAATSILPPVLGFQRTIVEDALVTAPIVITAERLFVDEHTGALAFDEFAAADADHDGILSSAEIKTAPGAVCGKTCGIGVMGANLPAPCFAERFVARASKLLSGHEAPSDAGLRMP